MGTTLPGFVIENNQGQFLNARIIWANELQKAWVFTERQLADFRSPLWSDSSLAQAKVIYRALYHVGVPEGIDPIEIIGEQESF